jgi:hypothetical protein
MCAVTTLWRWSYDKMNATTKEVLSTFESLGDNCEFGLVQRHCGIEPLGLFRFSFAAHEHLIHALNTRFEHYGVDGDLVISMAPNGELICDSKRYGFRYHTGTIAAGHPTDTILKRETIKVGYLKARLISDLESSEKIFVRKGSPGEHLGHARELAAAIRAFGNGTLLWVVQDGAEKSGRLENIDEGLMQGWITRFAPYTDANNIDLGSWVILVRNALCFWRDKGDHYIREPANNLMIADVSLVDTVWLADSECELTLSVPPPRAGISTLRHVLTTKTEPPREYVAIWHANRVDMKERHVVVSSWVWIPKDFGGTLVTATLRGFPRLSARNANLSLRETWQLTWCAAATPKNTRTIMPGLVVLGKKGDTVYSSDWRLEADVIPSSLFHHR